MSHWKKGVAIAATGLLALLLLDRAVGYFAARTEAAREVVDIQQPSILAAKLEYLRNFSGYRIVLLGDSLVFGRTLEQAGDPDWREHNLAPQLEREIRKRKPGQDVLVLNLGIDGALPADVEKLATLVVSCKPDVVIVDTHLRPFSSNFAAPTVQYARPWLKEMAAPETENGLATCLLNHSALLRYRGLLQERLIESRLAASVRDLRDRLNGHSPADHTSLDSMGLLLQIQERLADVRLGDDNPQAAAFGRMLAHLRERQQRTIVFYARENPDLLYGVIDRKRHDRLYHDLVAIVERYQGEHITYQPPLPQLQPIHYIDFTHLNAQGYAILAEQLASRISPRAIAIRPRTAVLN